MDASLFAKVFRVLDLMGRLLLYIRTWTPAYEQE